MENLKNHDELRCLSLEEMENIRGGESGWYAVAYLVGSAARFIKEALENPPNLPSASVYK